jgi:Ecdysteroid kinase-like family
MHQNEVLRVVQCCIDKNFIGTVDANDNDCNVRVQLQDASDLEIQTVCSLWAGMGHIYKVSLRPSMQNKTKSSSEKLVARDRSKVSKDDPQLTLIIKHIVLPTGAKLHDDLSNRRKTDSYYVEANFYERLAPILLSDEYKLSIPKPYYIERIGVSNDGRRKSQKGPHEVIIAMSYINDGENRARSLTRKQQLVAGLSWLATLHAAFWGSDQADTAVRTYGVQEQGSYWYLDTRPEEHQQMSNKGWEGRLKYAARAIADYLRFRDPYQCIIHGDAKEANILFGSIEESSCTVTFCDFQYCGKGSLTKDLVYFLRNNDNVNEAINIYLDELSKRLPPSVIAPTAQDLETALSLAYCDLLRFMIGWGWGASPNSFVQRVTAVLDRLDCGKNLLSEEAYCQALLREFG